MSGVNLVPGRPIGRNQLRLAVVALGFDPEHIRSFEVGGNTMEIAHGNSVYSRHEILEEDPWVAPQEPPPVLVVDLSGVAGDDRQQITELVSWFVSRARSRNDESSPF